MDKLETGHYAENAEGDEHGAYDHPLGIWEGQTEG
jgi:hypothetical protein